MRYLISKTKAQSKIARREYIFEAFKLYTLEKAEESNTFIVLDSIPLNSEDILFIIGHDQEVYQYLKENMSFIKESNIVAITCFPTKLIDLENSKKTLYIPKDKSLFIKSYDGSSSGFDFDITDCELDLYNSKEKTLLEKVEMCMTKLF